MRSPRAQERFKELEKEIKMKPFAKAALAACARDKADPAAAAKADAQAWLRRAVATLAAQKERYEARSRLSCTQSCSVQTFSYRLRRSMNYT